MKRLLFAFLSAFPVFLYGQNTISGTVLDKKTQEPLPYATVYIDGTTKGTATDDLGRFTLKNVTFPSTVVFSFVGYRTEAFILEKAPGELHIELNPNKALPQVDIDGAERDYHLDYFKKMFLGEDRWGKHAIIKNDEVLFFDSHSQARAELYSDDLKGLTENYDPDAPNSMMTLNLDYLTFLSFKKRTFTSFKVWAKEPLIVDLPLLGYELYVDLTNFTIQEDRWGSSKLCETLGYFYFKPYDTDKKLQNKKFEKNRKSAYYGSIQHFLRSWCQDRLSENGYAVVTQSSDSISMVIYSPDSLNLVQMEPVDMGRYIKTDGDVTQVSGLKGQRLEILYFHKHNGEPVKLKKGEDYPDKDYTLSEIFFKQDTCIFLNDGTVIDNDIVFQGDLCDKKVGSFLPRDYDPDED